MSAKTDICDFCSAPDPTWHFPADTYFDARLGVEIVAHWAACDACAELVCAGKYDALARRALLAPELVALCQAEPAMEGVLVREAKRLHQDFIKHRTGEPKRVQ